MIKVTLIDGDFLAHLECDKCRKSLLFALILIDHETPKIAERRALRSLAQKAGWMYVLASVLEDGVQDVCPKCIILPPLE